MILLIQLILVSLTRAEFSSNFYNFMANFFENTPYNDTTIADKLLRSDIASRPGYRGSLGGGNHTAGTPTIRQPVILVHGLTNTAGTYYVKHLRLQLLQNGWDESEIFATTYGSPNGVPLAAFDDNMKCDYVQRIRWLIEAVSAYTLQPVDVVAYSMGSPISRKAILGGFCVERHHTKLGPSLTHLIDAFVSVAGANRGLFLCNSILANGFPVCNPATGLKYSSAFIRDVNGQTHYEGTFVASIYSRLDDVVGLQCPNATNLCSPIAGSDDVAGGHMTAIDDSGSMAINLIYHHNSTIPVS